MRRPKRTFGETELLIASVAADLVQRQDCGCVFVAAERVAMCEACAAMVGMTPFGVIPKGHERCPTCAGSGFVKVKS